MRYSNKISTARSVFSGPYSSRVMLYIFYGATGSRNLISRQRLPNRSCFYINTCSLAASILKFGLPITLSSIYSMIIVPMGLENTGVAIAISILSHLRAGKYRASSQNLFYSSKTLVRNFHINRYSWPASADCQFD
jgi:hypothetical protein